MASLLAKMAADFRTTLASEIAVGGTTGTLQSYTDDDGVALPTGTYFFTLDGDGTKKEHIVCTMTAGALTAIKSISRQGVQTSGTARKHRIGASVVITDFAHVMYMNDLLKGTTDLDASVPLKYDGLASLTPGSNQLATVAYADSLTFAGAPNGSTTQKGIFEEATAAEINADTAAGSTAARLAINPSTLVTSKYGRGLAAFGGYAADGGSTDAYAITLSPAIAAYTVGQAITFKAATRNTGAATLNINSVGAQAIVKDTNIALETGDIKSNQMVTVVWDGTNFQMVTTNGPTPTGSVLPFAGRTTPSGYLLCDGSAVNRTTYAALFSVLSPSLGTFTVTIAAPGVATLAAHGLATGDSVYLTTTGALPTGLAANTRYWVTVIDANTFKFATSFANAVAATNITTTGSQSGTHTSVLTPYGIGDGSTTFNLPNLKGNIPVGLDQTATEFKALGQTGGEKTHVLTTTEMPSHTHTGTFGDFTGSAGLSVYSGANRTNASKATDPAGSDGAHNNLQPYVTMNYVIKV